MACNCKHNEKEIQQGLNLLKEFRELFIKRMSIDNGTDKRRKDWRKTFCDVDNCTRK